MNKRLLFVLFLLFPFVVNAQLKVAILPATDKTGEVKYAVKMMLTSSLTRAISKTAGYEAYDRVDLSAVLDEQSFQRTGMVSDQEIRKIGEMTGATFVLVTEAAPMDETCIVATAKIVNVESAKIENNAVAIVSINPREMEADCKKLTDELLDVDQPSANQIAGRRVTTPAENRTQMSATNEDLGRTYLQDAETAMQKKKYVDAVNAAVKVNDYMDYPKAWQIAGQAAQKAKQRNDAIKYFEKYLEADPEASDADAILYTIGALYQSVNNIEKAKDYYELLASDPKYTSSPYRGEAARMLSALNASNLMSRLRTTAEQSAR